MWRRVPACWLRRPPVAARSPSASILHRKWLHWRGVSIRALTSTRQISNGCRLRRGGSMRWAGPFLSGTIPRPEASLVECMRVLAPGGRIAFSWWDDPSRQRIQGVFREALAEVRAVPPAGAPQGHNIFRFSDRTAFEDLLRDAGLAEVRVDDHNAVSTFADSDAVWHGGLGSFVLTGAMIKAQEVTTQKAIRAAFDRLIQPYATAAGIALPVAFKIGSGRKPA